MATKQTILYWDEFIGTTTEKYSTSVFCNQQKGVCCIPEFTTNLPAAVACLGRRIRTQGTLMMGGMTRVYTEIVFETTDLF